VNTIVAAVFGFFYLGPGSMQALQQQASGQEQRSEPIRAEAERLKSRPNILTFRPKANLTTIIPMNLPPIKNDES
jgi:hypothetical protein